MEILSQGEKIKRIRKNFKIRQQDITGGEITRELISIIENNKTNLTPNVAQIIADNINRICKERDIDFSVEASYLLEDIKEQSNKIADNYIEFLVKNENSFSESLVKEMDEIEVFCMKYGEPEKNLALYEKIGEIYGSQKDYDKSYMYYVKALENATRVEDSKVLAIILEKIGDLCLTLMKYEEAIHFNNLALKYGGALNRELKYKLIFNNILANINLKKYNKALEEIEEILSAFPELTYEELFEIHRFKANCLKEMRLFNDSFKLSKAILDEFINNNVVRKILILTDILNICIILKDYKNIKTYLKKLNNELSNGTNTDNDCCIVNAHLQVGIASTLLQDIEQAKVHFEKVISMCKSGKSLELLGKALGEYLNALVLEKNLESINDFKNNILELLSLKIIDHNDVNIIKLIQFYNSIEDRESIDNMLLFILENK